MPGLYEILYCSEVAPEQPSTIVPDILTGARASNLRLDVTGVLIFDGQYFLQLIEGESETVRALMNRIENDPRHHTVLRLAQQASPARRFTRFSMGYCYAEGTHTVENVKALDGTAAIDALMAAIPAFDLDD